MSSTPTSGETRDERVLDLAAPDRVAGPLPKVLRTLNDAGVIGAGDIHTARRVLALSDANVTPLNGATPGANDDPDVILAVALAVRAPRFGHVYVDLATAPQTVSGDDGRVVALPEDIWPQDLEAWVGKVASAALVAGPGIGQPTAPLILDGTKLYLSRFYTHETTVARWITSRTKSKRSVHLSADLTGTVGVKSSVSLTEEIAAVCGDNVEQAAAIMAGLSEPLSVIAGGPGTGKTATIAKLVEVLTTHGERRGGGPVRIIIAAPTGKAAARLNEALRSEGLNGVEARTIHGTLGWWPNQFRMRYNAENLLPADFIILDEVSMVSVGILARFIDAVHPAASVVLVGDPDQLDAVEAGSVLADLTFGATEVSRDPTTQSRVGVAVTTLQRVYRFPQNIRRLATAIRDGDADEVLTLLNGDDPALLWVDPGPTEWPRQSGPLKPVTDAVLTAARGVIDRALLGDGPGALAATLDTRMLCAHRRGPDSVEAWNRAVEEWLHAAPSYRRPEWYAGRPIMVTRNDRSLGVHNGDIGVAVRHGERLAVHIDGRSSGSIDPLRLGDIQTVHAMTIHKSQGSAFNHVIVVLPSEPSPILTRQLLYTAVTRARSAVTIVASEASLRHAVIHTVSRASGLMERLGPVGAP